MILGYNTNGLQNHAWRDALALIAETGYQGVAITVDHGFLNPYADNFETELAAVADELAKRNLTSVIETGARFLLDPRAKHEPTLMTADPAARAKRFDFLNRCIKIADRLGSVAVSFWSGILRETISEDDAFQRLATGCSEVAEFAAEKNVTLAFEPEPGMFIETLDQFARLREMVDAPHFGLTIDIGHVQCVEAITIPAALTQWKDQLVNIHIEDMKRGVHEHLRFGEGEIDFPAVMKTLKHTGYAGPVNVELSRHSHIAPEVLAESYHFLMKI